MARRSTEPQDPASDIRIDLPEGPGFRDVPRPEMSANETARAMSGAGGEIIGPVALPEEVRATVQHHPMRTADRTPRRPIADIVDQFLADVQTHPDAHMLSTTLAGPADESEAQCFPDAPVRSLRVDRIAIIRRTTAQLAPAPSQTSERQRWQEQVIAGHVSDMRAQQEAKAAQQKAAAKPAIDPEQLAMITAAVVAAMKAQQPAPVPQAATA